jgi:phosphoribosylformylglycinamidine synthase
MDFKQPGNAIFIVGETRNELGGSHFALVNNYEGGHVPKVDPERARDTFAIVHQAIVDGLVRACHDLSEGGLAVAAAEMAFAGELGATLFIDRVPCGSDTCEAAILLFSESNTRFLCEVEPSAADTFEARFGRRIPCQRIGIVESSRRLHCRCDNKAVIEADVAQLREAWQATLQW